MDILELYKDIVKTQQRWMDENVVLDVVPKKVFDESCREPRPSNPNERSE